MAKKVIVAATKYKETAMWIRLGGMLVTTVLVAMTVGCTQKEQVSAAVIEDKVFTVTPVSVQVKAGILTGEMAEMKVTERIEKGSGRIDSPPKLTGTLKLKNNSTDQSVRSIEGKIQYIGADEKVIKLEETRNNLAIKSDSYGSSSERLDPGQEAMKSVNVDFPAEALEAKKLKDIRLELIYLPSAYKDETVNLAVSISSQ
jgi:hypothetical protein